MAKLRGHFYIPRANDESISLLRTLLAITLHCQGHDYRGMRYGGKDKIPTNAQLVITQSTQKMDLLYSRILPSEGIMRY